MMGNEEVRPFELNVDSSEIKDLKLRLRAALWPEKETVDDWSQGVLLSYHREFCEYWAKGHLATVCNGVLILENDRHTGAKAGEVLRRKYLCCFRIIGQIRRKHE